MVDFDKDRDANLAAFELTGGAAANGLTVRDYFAARAVDSFDASDPVAIAARAYDIADAMMAERSKPVCSREGIATIRVSRLGLTIRTENCLRSDGIETIGQLIELSEKDLLKIPNLGRGCLVDIRIALQRFKLKLKSASYSATEAFGLEK